MDRSEGSDDELYPAAPVPAHERQWRHPSEIGAQAWVASEPPLTIGRGLTAATGAIGVGLALAVLWTMLPTHAGRSAVSVRSTVANALSFPTSSSAFADTTVRQPPATTAPTRQTTVSTKPRPTHTTVPVVVASPLPTYEVARSGLVESAVAVAVNNGALVITTANAVSSDNTVDLVMPSGATQTAHVLLVDQRSGFAVLAHESSPSMDSFTVAPSVEPGDQLTFYGAKGVTAVVQDDGSITTTGVTDDTESTDPPDLREGTPVVNQRGELVALCSHDDTGPVLVSLAHLDQLRRALSNAAPNRVWLGVVVKDDAGGTLTIGKLDADGPAAAAGLLVGDVIESINGITVVDVSAVGAALAGRQPGDKVSVTVRRGVDGTTLDVVLASPHASL